MASATPGSESLPTSGPESKLTLSTQDASDSTKTPLVGIVSPTSSAPVDVAREPLYPQQTVYHRAGNSAGSSGLGTADTSDPTAVPTWVGYVSTTSNSGQAHLKVKPHGNWGAPPSGANYYVDTGSNWENLTGSGAPSGGTGSEYDVTMTGNLAHSHSGPTATGGGRDGARVVVMASGGISTNTASSVPSGAVGGPGTSWVEFEAVLTTNGSNTSDATIYIMQWDDLLGVFVHYGTQTLTSVSTTVGDSFSVRIPTDGYWYYCQLNALTGTGGTVKITASVQ